MYKVVEEHLYIPMDMSKNTVHGEYRWLWLATRVAIAIATKHHKTVLVLDKDNHIVGCW